MSDLIAEEPADEPVFLVDLKRLVLQPGDVIIARLTNENLRAEQFERASEAIHRKLALKFPGHEILILGPGIELATVGA